MSLNSATILTFLASAVILTAVPSPDRPARVFRWLRHVLPWAVALALLAWVFSRVPLGAFGEALSRGHFHWFIPAMAAVMAVIYLADCFAIAKTFSWFTIPMSYKEVLRIRGASYLMSVVNYNLGQGAIILFAKRAKGLSLRLGTGTVLFLMGINLLVMVLLAAGALALGAAPKAATLWPWVIGLLVLFIFYLGAVASKPAFLSRIELLQPILRAGVSGHLLALLVRLPHIALVLLAHLLGMLAFDLRPPMDVFFAYLPVMLLISALPISPQGLGTAQVAAVFFFSAYAPGAPKEQAATALAYSLTASGTAMIFMLVIGLFWFRSAMKLLGLGAGGDDEAGRERGTEKGGG